MTVNALEIVRTFLEGVASGDADLATRHVDPERYVEHDPEAADGVAGLRERAGRAAPGRRLEVVRTVQDGAFVVTHAKEDGPDGGRVLFDVFRLDGERIVEHWRFAMEAAPPNESGHTQTDGPTGSGCDGDTEASKAAVRSYYETVHLGGRHDQIRRFMSGEVQIRHEPGVGDGVTAFEQDLAVLTRNRTIDEIVLFAGQGDLVFLAARGTHDGASCAYTDLYRVEDGKLVEHWGFPQPIPPEDDRRNRNGVL